MPIYRSSPPSPAAVPCDLPLAAPAVAVSLYILVWPTQLDLDPAHMSLFVCVCVFPSEVMTPLFGVTSSNFELRNYVIPRQNSIKSSYVIHLCTVPHPF